MKLQLKLQLKLKVAQIIRIVEKTLSASAWKVSKKEKIEKVAEKRGSSSKG